MTNPTKPAASGQVSRQLAEVEEFIDVKPSELKQRRHLIDLDDLSVTEITELLNSAEGMLGIASRGMRKTPALRGKTIITMFFENSTRTRVSFEQAGKVLGADVINVTASASSVSKGESLLNTVKTLQAMQIDALVVRHPDSGAPYFISNHTEAAVVNAGDGMHAHPTQSLLDLFTVRNHVGDIEGKKIAIVGDILYSRVARSDIIAFQKMGAHVTVACPNTLLPNEWQLGSVLDKSTGFGDLKIASSVDEAIDSADVVMPLRIQQERQDAGHLPSFREYSDRWGVNETRMALANDGALLMHPGPMNEGVEISSDVAHGNQSVIQEQVKNGVAVRMAVLYALCAPRKSTSPDNNQES
ncbi:MAG: aspartate carbamoyltransferase catalytic subunit [SAR202 cluster bacterium]|nr:aspartate carbamoyltransferase [Chloroflexota bacterium]MQG88644.1 aspartate carbamoyltransferase catalytic subunit [SAR202 cluster bacterium]|tara:strand:- start:3664 stop:4734 length:1071 start_codon:yes stop_codon:yes gene_type:complete